MADELLDLVDDQDQVIGTVLRSQVHQNPKLIHREVAIAIFNRFGEVLLQQRSLTNQVKPGIWTVSATGHVGAGESPHLAATREVFEELGLTVKPVFFEKIFNTHSGRQTRFVWVYYAILDLNPKLELAPIEVAQASWVKIADLEKFSQNNDFPTTSGSYQIITKMAKILKL